MINKRDLNRDTDVKRCISSYNTALNSDSGGVGEGRGGGGV